MMLRQLHRPPALVLSVPFLLSLSLSPPHASPAPALSLLSLFFLFFAATPRAELKHLASHTGDRIGRGDICSLAGRIE
jgi:hypothetical protein